MLDYFSIDLDGGFNRHETADEAKDECEKQLDYARDEASDGWPEETDGLCWGIVLEDAQVVGRKPAPEGSEFEDIVEYAMRSCADPTELDKLRTDVKKWRTRSFEALELLAQAVKERDEARLNAYLLAEALDLCITPHPDTMKAALAYPVREVTT